MRDTAILNYTDYSNYPVLWAKRLGVSMEAVDLYLESDVIDLHTDSYIWKRIFGYGMAKRHRFSKLLPFMSQVDMPRCLEASMTGIVWDLATNPLNRDKNKLDVTRRNIEMVLADIHHNRQHFRHVLSYSDYLAARKEGKVASWLSLQGGQAIDNNLDNLDKIPEIHRITLVHFTRSKIGASNADSRNAGEGLSSFGKSFVEKMVENKICVDLAHINRKGFFDALEIVPEGVPVLVTHTGIKGVWDMWRNIDDEQIKAIAATGGTIGIIFHPYFLSGKLSCSVDKIIDHMEHVIKVAGEDFVSLGSDYDGLITLPRELKDITCQPWIVQKMLDRKWSYERIKKILGINFLRAIRDIRP
jgi:membrane dipeptidase